MAEIQKVINKYLGKPEPVKDWGKYALIKLKGWTRWHLARQAKNEVDYWIACGTTIDAKFTKYTDGIEIILIEDYKVPMPAYKVCYHCRSTKAKMVKDMTFTTMSELAKEEADKMAKKPDEEDITVDKTPEKKSKLEKVPTGRDNIDPPYFECVKCLSRYAMKDCASYIPEDNTGISLEVLRDFNSHLGNKKHNVSDDYTRKARIYRCSCGHPVLISVGNRWNCALSEHKVFVGRPVVK
jgi:hypothetical protein